MVSSSRVPSTLTVWDVLPATLKASGDNSPRPRAPSRASGTSSPQSSSSGRSNTSKFEPNWAKLKTEMCRNFKKDGRCEFAKTCWYAHSPDEIRSSDDKESGEAALKLIQEEKRKLDQQRAQAKNQTRKHKKRPNHARNFHNRECEFPCLDAVPVLTFSSPPPRSFIPSLNVYCGRWPHAAEVKQATKLQQSLDSMLRQERTVINLKEEMRRIEQKLTCDELDTETKTKLEHALKARKIQLSAEEKLFAQKMNDLKELLEKQKTKGSAFGPPLASAQ
ncbi:hypothetical protein L596_029652 [Steinernema carpocapsae]|uniref:C3H1-type domain-containing protein n=1 Tax=Steinernema carpocapsae TaxID=34508 RepID=A0A4U5LV97_STECR|nr:hypothetical protein L596_029652 [Steinernema carpocapsae]